MVKIGRIIHAFRKEKGMTLKDLAAKTGISPSYLSQIENDQVNMCIDVLEKISIAVEKPLSFFFLQDSLDSISIVKTKQRKRVKRNDGALVEYLTDNRVTKFDITVVHYPADYRCQEHVVHQGEEFMLVLEGDLTVNLGNIRNFFLTKGDSIAFTSKIPHKVSSKNGAEVLIHSGTAPYTIL